MIIRHHLLTNKARAAACGWVAAFSLCSSAGLAQTVNGTVADRTGPLSGAVVENSRLKQLVVTDVQGGFTIRATAGDTLYTSFVGCKRDTLRVGHQPDYAITLTSRQNQLNEVVVKGTRLTPLEQYHKNQANYKQIYRIGNDKQLFSVVGGAGHAGVGISIDALYSAWSKEGKDARRLQRVLQRDYENSVIDSRFTQALVARVTGYSGQRLEEFMADNRTSLEFARQASDYDLIQYIKRRVTGVVLATDNPITAKPAGSGFKVRFKMPHVPATTRPTGTELLPLIHR